MNPKTQEKLAHKLVVLSMLLIENLDELKVTSPEIKKYREDITEFSELLLEEIKDTEGVLKTTYFQELSHKVDTIIRKNLNIEL